MKPGIRSFVPCAVALVFCWMGACSSSTTTPAPGDAGQEAAVTATLKIVRPSNGDSFAITPDEVDVDFEVAVTGFTLVPLGQEGADSTHGQVRAFVDGKKCNDPGENGEPPSPYNRILPNEKNEATIGLDYCAGGTVALDDKDHVLRAELWHGETNLGVFDEITFHTTFSLDGGSDASSD